jgi:LPS sulfotransferase NodH
LLCETLAATGVAGRPPEYFQHLSETGSPRTPRDYFGEIEDPGVLDLWGARTAA